MRFAYTLLFIITLGLSAAFSQSADTLKMQLDTAQGVSKLKILNKLTWKFRNSDPEEALKYALEAIKLGNQVSEPSELMKAYSFAGVVYRNLGIYTEAFDQYYMGLELAKIHNNLEQMGYSYINLANLYLYQDQYERALSNLYLAEPLANKLGDKKMMAYVALNKGRSYMSLMQKDSAIHELTVCYEIRRELNDPEGMGVSIKYIGDVYFNDGDFKKSMEYYYRASAISNPKTDKDLFADIMESKAKAFFSMQMMDSALDNGQKSLAISMDIGSKLRIKNAYEILANISIYQKNYPKAIFYMDNVTKYKDTLYNDQVSKKIASIEYSSEQLRKQAEIDMLNRDKELSDKELERQKTLIYVALVVILVVLTLLFFLIGSILRIRRINNFLHLQKTEIFTKNAELNVRNEEIESQRDNLSNLYDELGVKNADLSNKQKQIMDSIVYAKRIQNALFPTNEFLQKNISDFFIFNRPRDIVSGDFYWATKKGDNLYLAVADCTGHGVPGAFMSLLSISFLNEIVTKHVVFSQSGELETNIILGQLRTRIKTALNQTGKVGEAKDGLDIALCRINLDSLVMQFSGAHNPALVIRGGTQFMLRPDPMPIAIYIREDAFTHQIFQLQKNDNLYMFTDGFADQIGGERGRKFFLKNLKDTLSNNSTVPMTKQLGLMEKELEDWMGPERKQIDDILVAGFRF